MSDAIEALSEYKYLLESMGHDAQSTGPYMRCLDAIASLQAMQGEAVPQPAVPDDTKRLDYLIMHLSGRQFRDIGVVYSGGYSTIRDAIDEALLSAAKRETE